MRSPPLQGGKDRHTVPSPDNREEATTVPAIDRDTHISSAHGRSTPWYCPSTWRDTGNTNALALSRPAGWNKPTPARCGHCAAARVWEDPPPPIGRCYGTPAPARALTGAPAHTRGGTTPLNSTGARSLRASKGHHCTGTHLHQAHSPTGETRAARPPHPWEHGRTQPHAAGGNGTHARTERCSDRAAKGHHPWGISRRICRARIRRDPAGGITAHRLR